VKRIIGVFFGLAFGLAPYAASAQPIVPNNSIAINVTTSGITTTQLIANSGVTSIYVTSFNVVGGGSGAVTFEYGTGTNCGVGTTALTGAYPLIADAGVSVGSGTGTVLRIPSGNALCIVTTAATAGSLSYLQY
jgi:hypothetical protein